MPDAPENPPKVTSRHRPRLTELSKETTEDDLWDLDERTAPPEESPAEAGGGEAEPVTSEPEAIAPAPAQPELFEHAPKSTVAPRGMNPATRAEKPRVARRPGNAARPDDPAAETSTAPAATEGPAPAAEPAAAPLPGGPIVSGRKEVIGLAAMALLALGIGIWWVFSLFDDISTARLGDDQPKFPATGEHGVVADAETYWREPVTSGPDADVTRRGVNFIPVIEITLKSGERGVLRAIFRNRQGEPVGDNISRSYANGKFTSSDSPTAAFPATDGFTKRSEFHGYRVGDERWTVEILEGPSATAPGGAFKPLFTAPISPNRR